MANNPNPTGKGGFKPGESGNPKGRPPRAKEEKFLKITISSVKLADWREIVKKAVEQAKRGNPTARKWLSDHLLGVPKQRLDLTSDDKPIYVIGVGIDTDKL